MFFFVLEDVRARIVVTSSECGGGLFAFRVSWVVLLCTAHITDEEQLTFAGQVYNVVVEYYSGCYSLFDFLHRCIKYFFCYSCDVQQRWRVLRINVIIVIVVCVCVCVGVCVRVGVWVWFLYRRMVWCGCGYIVLKRWTIILTIIIIILARVCECACVYCVCVGEEGWRVGGGR